ncbi:MAG: hypothetical protein ACIAQZ_06240 [Sedimentisphaeraceae bacterium JB056]
MSAEITAELLEAFNEYVSENRYIKYRAIEAAFKLFMAAPETLQLKLMREDAITADLSVKYSDKPSAPNSKRKKFSIDIGKDGEQAQAVSIDKSELEALEGVIKQIVQEQLGSKKD